MHLKDETLLLQLWLVFMVFLIVAIAFSMEEHQGGYSRMELQQILSVTLNSQLTYPQDGKLSGSRTDDLIGFIQFWVASLWVKFMHHDYNINEAPIRRLTMGTDNQK